MSLRTYKTEFPNFELEVVIPPGFEDTSWHNDSCPSFYDENLRLKIFVDYEDPQQSEIYDFYKEQRTPYCRFYACETDEEGLELHEGGKSILTDSWDAVLVFINEIGYNGNQFRR